MKLSKSLLILFAILVFTGAAQAQGPWSPEKGSGYFKLSEWWLVADQHFTDSGDLDPNLTNALYQTAIYGNYGLSDRLSGIVYFPFYVRSLYNNTISGTTGETITPGDAINTIGDAELSLQYQLWKGRGIALSTSVGVGLPLGETGGGELGILQTGDGEFNQWIRFDAGKSFQLGGTPAYASIYGAYNNRTEGFSDELRYGIEGGVGFFERQQLYLIFRLYGINPLRNGADDLVSDGASIFANNTEHLTFAPEIAWSVTDHLGISGGFGKALYGKLIFANTSYTAGIFFKL